MMKLRDVLVVYKDCSMCSYANNLGITSWRSIFDRDMRGISNFHQFYPQSMEILKNICDKRCISS
jgi:hypothetical protein